MAQPAVVAARFICVHSRPFAEIFPFSILGGLFIASARRLATSAVGLCWSRSSEPSGSPASSATTCEPFAPRRKRHDQHRVGFHDDALAMLLGMVINVGRQVDGKVKMQNAADAATYSGGVVLARGMNTLAFTNHLLCDIFATTAILREAQQRNAASLVPEVLQAWSTMAPAFSQSTFAKFAALGPAISAKVPLEQQMVTSFSNWIGAVSSLVLPTWEQILAQQLIPDFPALRSSRRRRGWRK